MHIPDWFDWIFLGLAVLQAVALVPVIRRLRGLDSAVRLKGRLDVLETVGSLLLLGGLLLGSVVAESWFWLTCAGFVHVRRLRREGRPLAPRPPPPHGLIQKTGPSSAWSG
ncbi:hypothetical protein ACN6K9_004120 [Streptomyces sp. SAS_267]|uniref:hypothetical protein n=1 Tax=Streptomyces sp. SAS_267 TaxID=3412750 RepID=UPI00403C4B56